MNQKLEDFDDFLHSRNTSVCTPTNSEKPTAQQFGYKKQKLENGFIGVFDAAFNPNGNTNSFSHGNTGIGTLSGSPSGTLGAELISDQSHSRDQLSLIERSQILKNLNFQKTFKKSISQYKDEM